MKLELNNFDNIYEYSDKNIEDKIIKFIKKYPDDYEKAFKEDSSWPIVYNLSNIRKNSIRWYPFNSNSSILEIGGEMGAITEELCSKCKKVTTVELSKKNASIIKERNKNNKNLKIIVGNFKNIKLAEKYDYILLNGTFKYAPLYIESENPYEDFLNFLKSRLKKNGRILIAIENRFGLKYWCGSCEDFTGVPFYGIRNYPGNEIVRTFNKFELETLADKIKMNINFYYMFPDYKFPEIVYSDISLNENIFAKYYPYYSEKEYLSFPETEVFLDIYKNKEIPFFANSYFIELSNHKIEPEIEFVKFNSFRRNEYNLYTYKKNDKFYKRNVFDSGKEFLTNYYNNNSFFVERNVDFINVKKDSEGFYTDEIFTTNLQDKILSKCGEVNLKKLINELDIYDKYLKNIYQSDFLKNDLNLKNVFEEYNIKISKSKIENLHFVENAFIDIIPQNILISGSKFLLIDQEWCLKNAPYEFILYRGILSVLSRLKLQSGQIDDILTNYGINKYKKEFELLEQGFQKKLERDCYNETKKYFNYRMYNDLIIEKDTKVHLLNLDIINLNQEIEHIKNEKELLENDLIQNKKNMENLIYENKKLNDEIRKMLNSRSWKITKPLRKVTNKFSDLKNKKNN